MASFFNLILDTLAPSGLTLLLNNGATLAGEVLHEVTADAKSYLAFNGK